MQCCQPTYGWQGAFRAQGLAKDTPHDPYCRWHDVHTECSQDKERPGSIVVLHGGG